MKKHLATRHILTCAILTLCSLFCACGTPGQIEVNTPENKFQNYPPVVENSSIRRQGVLEAWKKLLADAQLQESNLDLETVLNTPRALPPETVGKIRLHQPRSGAFHELEAKESLRRFIERASDVLFPNQTNDSANASARPVSLKDLSLVTFVNDHDTYRAVYRQASYPFPISGGFGELRLVADKNGTLLQMNSRIIPALDLPTHAEITPDPLVEKMIGRSFGYKNNAGQSLIYKVRNRSEIKVKGLVVYPKQEGNRITIHLAYPVEAGQGMTWTVYVDAITAQEIDVNQNFTTLVKKSGKE